MIIKVKYPLRGSLIRQVLALKRSIEPFDAGTYSPESPAGEKYAAGLRKTEVRWVAEQDHQELYDEIHRIVTEHQAKLGVTARLRFAGDMQLATYREGHHFTWHRDVGDADPVVRLISLSVLLTADFAGGQFEFMSPVAPKLRKAGDIVMFNSDETHRVAAVTRGVRNSLVAWLTKA